MADISCIIHASLLCMASLRVCSWYEHVDSKANIADRGTRNSDEVAKALGVLLEPKSLPLWLSNTATAPPSYWLQWLDRNVGQRLAIAAAQDRSVKPRVSQYA